MLAALENWERFFLFIAGVLLVGLIGHHLVYGILRRLARRTESMVDDMVLVENETGRIEDIRSNYPDALPKVRAELQGIGGRG